MSTKTLVQVCILITLSISQVALAQIAYTEKEMKNYFKTHEVCNLAIGFVDDISPKFKSGEAAISHQVYCVTDMSVNVGTIKEAKGCALALYDVNKNAFRSTYSRGEDPSKLHKSGFAMAEGTSCPDGGFDKLLKMNAGLTYGNTVKDLLTKGRSGFNQKLFLLGFTPGFDKWWNTNVSKQAKK